MAVMTTKLRYSRIDRPLQATFGLPVAIVLRRGFGDGISYFGLWPRVTGAMRRRAYYYTLFAGGHSVNTITWWRPVGVKR